MKTRKIFTSLLAWLILTLFANQQLIAQPKERLKNRYRETNMSYGAPYTMFDISMHPNNKSTALANSIEELTNLLKLKLTNW